MKISHTNWHNLLIGRKENNKHVMLRYTTDHKGVKYYVCVGTFPIHEEYLTLLEAKKLFANQFKID